MEKELFLVIKRETDKKGKLGDYVLAADNFLEQREEAVKLRNTVARGYAPKIVRIDGTTAVTLQVVAKVIRLKYSRRKDGKTTKEKNKEKERTQPTPGQKPSPGSGEE